LLEQQKITHLSLCNGFDVWQWCFPAANLHFVKVLDASFLGALSNGYEEPGRGVDENTVDDNNVE